MTKHTQTCLGNQAETNAQRAAYAAQWPNHCWNCDGWGGRYSSYDPSPAGVSLGSGSYQEYDPCETCYCNGHCPRCGQPMAKGQELFDEKTPCRHCGFKEGDAGMPPVAECDCWYTQELEPITYWVYDNLNRRAQAPDGSQVEFTFAVSLYDMRYDALLAQAFITACRGAGLLASDHTFVIAGTKA